MSSPFISETVLDVRHWTGDYFSFTTSRDDGFRFDNGQFVMIGLEVDGKPLMRAYSIASANWEEQLEFFSIKVANGPLTSRLQHIQPGDTLLMSRKPTGTLLISDLLPGRNLYLLSTGTGLAPFLAIIKDPETYERFDKVVLRMACAAWPTWPMPTTSAASCRSTSSSAIRSARSCCTTRRSAANRSSTRAG